jgi:hypothetical protein
VGGGATVLNAASIGRVHLPPRIVALETPNGSSRITRRCSD